MTAVVGGGMNCATPARPRTAAGRPDQLEAAGRNALWLEKGERGRTTGIVAEESPLLSVPRVHALPMQLRWRLWGWGLCAAPTGGPDLQAR
jgi:hypothetical protein